MGIQQVTSVASVQELLKEVRKEELVPKDPLPEFESAADFGAGTRYFKLTACCCLQIS